MAVQAWVKELVESICWSEMEVGRTLKHPDGRTVKIVAGTYWGESGISNFWTWREVKKNGKLGKLESGYGW